MYGKNKKEIQIPWWVDKGLNESKEHPYTKVTIDNENYYYLHTFSYFQPDLN